MKTSKVYSLGSHGSVSTAIGAAIGLGKFKSQAEVIVSAPTKKAAYALLEERHLAPRSINDKEFRVDESTPTALLLVDGVLTDGVVLAMQLTSANTPVVRIEADGSIVKVGEFRRGDFTRAAGLASPAGTPTVAQADLAAVAGHPDEAEMVLAQLAASMDRLNALEAELARARNQRAELCRRAAYDLKIAGQAAEAMDVSPGRVYQLATAALRTRASQGEYLPGLWVEIEDPDRHPDNWDIGQVVDRPDDAVSPDAESLWVWVRTNGNTFPVRFHRLRAWSPKCSQCPPEKQLDIRTSAALAVHQISKHGVSR